MMISVVPSRRSPTIARTVNPNTHRAHASAIDRVIGLLGRDRPLVEVVDAETGQALAEL